MQLRGVGAHACAGELLGWEPTAAPPDEAPAARPARLRTAGSRAGAARQGLLLGHGHGGLGVPERRCARPLLESELLLALAPPELPHLEHAHPLVAVGHLVALKAQRAVHEVRVEGGGLHAGHGAGLHGVRPEPGAGGGDHHPGRQPGGRRVRDGRLGPGLGGSDAAAVGQLRAGEGVPAVLPAGLGGARPPGHIRAGHEAAVAPARDARPALALPLRGGRRRCRSRRGPGSCTRGRCGALAVLATAAAATAGAVGVGVRVRVGAGASSGARGPCRPAPLLGLPGNGLCRLLVAPLCGQDCPGVEVAQDVVRLVLLRVGLDRDNVLQADARAQPHEPPRLLAHGPARHVAGGGDAGVGL
mmetsp:Transcript_17049/g.64561  ORF Transcript_17049/g.64561 Transcript_17049/m.64561 type:complete len:359 (-) Transcript_17049:563-1639(-)